MKLKVFMPAAGEGWIGDVTTAEFEANTKHACVSKIEHADVVWLYSKWIANHFPVSILKSKPCVTTVHHIVPEKGIDIEFFDYFTDVYHVPNDITLNALRCRTGDKEIVKLPYWVPTAFKRTNVEAEKNNVYTFGSFQRDTEGSSIKSDAPQPKLEKGPDILVSVLERFWDNDFRLMLGGWRRQYVKSRVPSEKLIDFTDDSPDAKSFATHEQVNVAYNMLRFMDGIYLVTSRHEGGPQAILESAATGCKILSTDVGIAAEFLHPLCICGNADDPNTINVFEQKIRGNLPWDEIIEFNALQAKKLSIENVVSSYDELICNVYEKYAHRNNNVAGFHTKSITS